MTKSVRNWSYGRLVFAAGMLLCCLLFSAPATARGAGEEAASWSLSAYAGAVTTTRFNEIVRLEADPRGSYVAALAAGRTVLRHEPFARWEAEVQLARHWGKQHHWETNAALLLRWTRFPWDDYLSTTIAIGVGPSWAWRTPALERERHKRTSRRLAFMPFEITAGPPGRSEWEAFFRVHHRSGAFDLFSRGGGSNFIAAGFRRFL